jgi:FlaA1/EpsC-like NDP-sugar epimerase
MRRAAVVASQLLIDLTVLSLAFIAAFLVRYDGVPPLDVVGRAVLTGPYIVGAEYVVLMAFGVQRLSWRYVSLRDLRTVLLATATAGGLLFAMRAVLGELQVDIRVLRHGVLPYGVLAANFGLMFLGIAGVRVLRRMVGERVDTRRMTERREQIPTMLIGAGQCGVLMARELGGASRPRPLAGGLLG